MTTKATTKRAKSKDEWNQYLLTLRQLRIGQSFVVKRMPSNYRLVLSALKVVAKRKYQTRAHEGGRWILRVY
jgi:hypothetical protein